MSSSRRQSSSTAAGLDLRARAEELDRVRLRERKHLVLDFAADAEQLARGHQQGQVRTGLGEGGQLGSRRRPPAQGCRAAGASPALRRAPRAPPSRLASARSSRPRAPDRAAVARPTQNTPALNSPTSSEAASIASRVFPEPPGPVKRHQPRVPQERGELCHLPIASDEARRRPWQVGVRDRLQRRKRPVAELEDRDRLCEVLHPVLAEIAKVAVHPIPGRSRE